MCSLIRFCLIFNVLVPDSFPNPVFIQSNVAKNGGQFEDASNSAASLQKGISNFEGNEGFNNLYGKNLLDSSLNRRYGEQTSVNNNHLDAANFNKGTSYNNNGAEGANLQNTAMHKKGHHKNGFHNSYHKDEVGSNSSFYDDGESEGGQQVYKNNQGSYANALEDNKRGDHSDRSSYNNQMANQGHYIKGDNYANDVNNVQNHNRKHYYDDRIDKNQRNVGRRYGDENMYNEENDRNHPASYVPYSRFESPKRRITIYEDPRYEVQPNRYRDDYVELDVRPARGGEYMGHQPYY